MQYFIKKKKKELSVFISGYESW